MPEKQRAWQTLCEPKYGKPVKIVVWKNKEFNSPGQEITLHPKFMRSWNAALGFVTLVLQPRFGAVRKLYHLETKKLVLCLQEIQQGDNYVAVGGEKVSFRKNGYLAGSSKMQNKKSPESAQLSSSNSSSNADLNFMVCTKKKKRTVLYFMVSGRACQTPIKVVLIERDLLDYTMILDYLGHRLDVGEGIQYLCDTRGKPIQDPADLKHGQLYVAVPHASTFLQLDYSGLFAKLLPPKTFKAAKPKRTKRLRVVNIKTDPVESQREDPASKDDTEENFEGVNKDDDERQEEDCPAGAAETSKLENNSEDGVEQVSTKSDKHVEVQVDAEGRWEQCKSSSGNAVLQAKCVGEKCVDQECRLLRKEFASLPASFYNIDGELEDIEADTNWDYAAGIQETVEEIVSDVNTVRDLLEDIVEESFVQVKHRGVATPAFIKPDSLPVLEEEEEDEAEDANFCHILPPSDPADESFDDSVTTVELEHNFQDKHLTTFADIARNRELEQDTEPLFAFDRAAFPDHTHPDYGRMSTVSRKGVSFMRVTSPDEDDKPLLSGSKPPSFSILKAKDEELKDDGTFCLVPQKSSFLGVRRDSVENNRDRLLSSGALDADSKAIQKDFAREDKGVQVPEVEESANITELAQEDKGAALSDIYHNFGREGPSVWEVIENGQLHIQQSKPPRTSILRRTSNSPLKLAAELKTHLPVVVRPSFVSVRSSITDSHSDQVKRRLSALLEKGVDVVSDERISVTYEEEEEDSLDEDASVSKGIQKDWKLNDEIVERAVQTGVSEALNDIVETACQTSNNRQRSLDGGSNGNLPKNGHWRSR